MLIVIPRKTNKKKFMEKSTKRNTRELKWYTRKYLFTMKKHYCRNRNRRDIRHERKIAKWQM